MSDDTAPQRDDLLLMTLEVDPESKWLLDLWSKYCESQGLPDGKSKENPLDYRKMPQYLDSLKWAYNKFEAGNLIALLDALHICRRESLPIPNWVVSGLEAFMLDTITNGAPGKRGRCNNPLARARQTVKQQKQRQVIKGIRMAQKVSPNADVLHFVMLSNEVKDYFKIHGALPLGSNLRDAAKLAEKCLRGTEFQATFLTLERLAKSASDETFEIEEDTVRKALGITALDAPPAPFGEFVVDWPVESWPEEAESGDAVKETAVFWVTIERKDANSFH